MNGKRPEVRGGCCKAVFDVLSGLNEAQKEAVLATNRHALVVAGPGTGKTLTIVRRIAYLIQQGTSPAHILAVTFTNRAAREMRERIVALIRDPAAGMFIGTFHLLGLKIMRECGMQPRICTRDEQVSVLASITGRSPKAARQTAERISRVKNLVEIPDAEIERVIDAYQETLRQEGMCDFDDLCVTPVSLFDTNLAARRCSEAVEHIIVDEYQDISPLQYQLLRRLLGDTASMCAVGDSDQAIYGFRGADMGNFLSFRKDFPDAALIVLSENYRSTVTITGAANAVIRNNCQRIDKDLRASREEGKPITILSAADARAEAEAVAREIETRIGGTSHYRLAGTKTSVDFSEASFSFSDFAVLFRTNAQARVFQDALSAWGIPCQVAGDKGFYQTRTLVERLKSELGSIPENSDSFDLQGYLKAVEKDTGLSDSDSALLQNLAAVYHHLPAREAVIAIIDELALFSAGDAFDPRADAVLIMTLHTAKGLEFKVVFLAGAEQGLIPFTLAGKEADLEEERRLFYVGMTRAKEELLLLHARSRFLYGQRLSGAPSPFLSEIPPHLIKVRSITDKKKKKGNGQMDLFS
jgi:superfamily I DNA/RNA helicase